MTSSWRVSGVDHIAINVRDLERMIAFYRDVLGCAVEHRQDALGLVHLRAGSILIDLIDRSGPLGPPEADEGGHNLNHICLRVDDFDADRMRDDLAARGVDVQSIRERYGSTGVARTLYFRDPEGNGLELRD